jgi:acylphosphatase
MFQLSRAEIIVDGIVQGVGFRYFVYHNAKNLGLKGYTKNLISGEVITEVEGETYLIDELIRLIKIGPRSAKVATCKVNRKNFIHEFTKFEIVY